MKNINLKRLLVLFVVLPFFGCTTDFIEEKKNYSQVNNEIYQFESLANRYVEQVYGLMSPGENSNMTAWSKAAAEHGSSSLFARSTEQYGGRTDLNSEYSEISISNSHCLRALGVRLGASFVNSAYTRIRYCNEYLTNIDDYNSLDEDFVNQIKGQLYFWRAWQYFELVRLYGGVPIVLTVLPGNVDDPDIQFPRNTSSETIDQIVLDLDTAIDFLNRARPYAPEEAGKITAAAAAALKGRVLLTWASPQFNRDDEQSRWQRAYDANLEAYNTCLAAGKGLDPNWRMMFFKDNGMESIFSFGFNNIGPNQDGVAYNNYTEYQSRSDDQDGNAGISPTKQAVDAFFMEDGTPYNPEGDLNDFYRNRDPRFYHTFAYNGSIWPYAQNPNYRNWTYFWYPLRVAPDAPKIATNFPQNDTGIYLKKFTNPNASNTNQFRNSGTDYMEIRFAEVVLNLAESAIGINSLAEAKGFIQDVRARAGVINADGQYGLSAYASRDQMFEAVINERKVEFAYENKRFHDLRRWLLYNDDYGYCSKLNQEPIEGMRRQGYYTFAKVDPANFYVGVADPFKGPNAPIINREATTYPDGITTYEEYVDYLYDNHFQVEIRDDSTIDPTDFEFTWYNEYYFFGIYQQLYETAPFLEQTQGWGGDFNPLL